MGPTKDHRQVSVSLATVFGYRSLCHLSSQTLLYITKCSNILAFRPTKTQLSFSIFFQEKKEKPSFFNCLGQKRERKENTSLLSNRLKNKRISIIKTVQFFHCLFHPEKFQVRFKS